MTCAYEQPFVELRNGRKYHFLIHASKGPLRKGMTFCGRWGTEIPGLSNIVDKYGLLSAQPTVCLRCDRGNGNR